MTLSLIIVYGYYLKGYVIEIIEEKLARRKQGQINKLKGLDTGTKSTPNNAGSTAAESSSAASSNWAVLTDDVNATQKIATSLYYNNPSNSSIGGKSGVVKTKSDKVNKRKVRIVPYINTQFLICTLYVCLQYVCIYAYL